MSRFAELYKSSIGKKFIASVTGFILFGFLVLHMVGNLKAFLGTTPDGSPDIDVYAHYLRVVGEPLLPEGTLLWATRIVLLVALILHVATVIELVRENRAARPVRYAGQQFDQTTWPARLMLWSGLLLFAFIVFHILQFTTGTVDVTPIVHGEVYANLYNAFHKWFFVAIYVTAMAFLCMHLYHGLWSLFQTVGLDNPDRNRGFRLFAAAFALILFVGFSSVPVTFFFGDMPSPPVSHEPPGTNITSEEGWF